MSTYSVYHQLSFDSSPITELLINNISLLIDHSKLAAGGFIMYNWGFLFHGMMWSSMFVIKPMYALNIIVPEAG